MILVQIIERLGVPWVTLLSMDSFYRVRFVQNILRWSADKSLNILYQVLSPEEHEAAARNEHNFDHPDAFDFPLLIHTLQVNKTCSLSNYRLIISPNLIKTAKYRVTHHVSDLSWVDLDFGCSTILLGQ